MPCTRVGNAIVCTRVRAKRCACGKRATRECDWKVKTKRSGTCDKGICDEHTHQPTPGKDLCQKHAKEWRDRQARRAAAAQGRLL